MSETVTEADLLSDIDPVLRRGDPNASEATSPLWVYVAGPMRGISEFNFPAFEEATTQLRALGYKVISPAEQDLGRGFDPTGLTGNEDLSSLGFDLRQALIADLNHIAYECDAICLLPGWEFSKGATVELDLAVALGLQVGTLEEFLDAEPMTEYEFLTGDLPMHKYPTAAGAVAARIGLTGPCDRRDRHDPHIETSGVTDTDGNIVLHECHGQASDCANCDDRKCMSCVFREVHDECRDDCPDCCNDLPAIIFPAEVRVTSSTGGQKGTKLARYDLIPVQPLWDVAELYGRGASKYANRNWERGYDWSLSFAAMQRHAQLFWGGEFNDTETGSPHLASVVFHAFALLEYARTHPEFDDRPGR